MPKKRTLKPDTVLKNYWKDNGQFADLFNAVLFDGRQIINPNELEDADSEEAVILEHRDYVKSLSSSRDNIKIRKLSVAYPVQFQLLGLEHQEHIHYAMPMRIMGYDYASYKLQYDSNAKKYAASDGMTADEYLSKNEKNDKFVPVITVLIYYGEKPWDGALSLHEMLNIPKELVQREEVLTYAKEHKVDSSVIMTVAEAANCSINFQSLDRKGESGMWAIFEETKKEGIKEGIKEGKAQEIVETNLEFGVSEQQIIEKLQRKLNVSSAKAKEYFELYGTVKV